MGSGRQYWPWISLADEIGAIRHLLTADVSGPVNLTGPEPVTNAEFTAELGRQVHRPTVLPVPAFALNAGARRVRPVQRRRRPARAAGAAAASPATRSPHADLPSALRAALRGADAAVRPPARRSR